VGELSIETSAGLDPLRDVWTALAPETRNVFSTWEWASTWWQHFGRDRPLRLAVCHDPLDRRPVAVVPAYVSRRRPLRVLRLVGHGPADQLGPVCRPEHRPVAAAATRRLDEPWDIFVGDALPGDEHWDAHLAGRVLRRSGNPVLRFPNDGWEGFLTSRSRNFRQQIRRRERRLQRDHRLSYRRTEDADRLSSDLDTLIRLHRDRWRGEGQDAFRGPLEAFHRQFAEVAMDRGWLRLWILDLDGQAAAAWYGFRYCGVELYYQAGRAPALDELGVGTVLLAHTMREAANDGIGEYRLARGGETFKAKFSTSDPGLVTVGVGRGARGRTALTATAWAAQLPAWARRPLTRLLD